MMDEEARNIRDEVVRALAEQGADVEALGYELPDQLGGEGDEVALPKWEGLPAALAALGAPAAGRAGGAGGVPVGAFGPASASGAAGDGGSLSEEDVERLFLAAVFDDARAQSAAAQLVAPSSWAGRGLVPAHQSPEEWEFFVYEYLEKEAALRDARQKTAVSESPARAATRAVGVPPAFRGDEEGPADPADADAETAPAGAAPAAPTDPADADADPATAVESAAEAGVSGLAAAPGESAPPPCDDIAVVVGKQSYYLYSSRFMTEAYARWAFLAREDDRLLTFAECVREESRTYPRPMQAASLANAPFNMTSQEVAELWRAARESGSYPDLETLAASNGDVYYFSTDYLSADYAASLAEWNSVERERYL